MENSLSNWACPLCNSLLNLTEYPSKRGWRLTCKGTDAVPHRLRIYLEGMRKDASFLPAPRVTAASRPFCELGLVLNTRCVQFDSQRGARCSLIGTDHVGGTDYGCVSANGSIKSWKVLMVCPSCTSAKQAEFTAEILIHSQGLKNIDKPGVWVYPTLLVCLDCGRLESTVPASQLASLVAAATSAN
jgi:hypothetical protein